MTSNSIKKYVAEIIGTFVLVLLGCGTAMLVGCNSGEGYILTAFAFGLVIVGMAYCVGNISGCHINPAVSLGVLISGGMSVTDFIGYVVSQCIGEGIHPAIIPVDIDNCVHIGFNNPVYDLLYSCHVAAVDGIVVTHHI